MANPGDYKVSQLNAAGNAWPDRIGPTLPGGGGVSGGDGASTREVFSQVAHGFSEKEAVFHNGTAWVRAKADVLATAHPDGVIESKTANTFTLVTGGAFNDLIGGWAANTEYYLSHLTAGLLVATQPPSPSDNIQISVLRTGPAAEAIVEIGEPMSLVAIPNAALATDAARPPQVSAPEIAAGTLSALRSFSPADVRAEVLAHAPTAAPISSQAGAEAGVNNTDAMTPLRTKQAITFNTPAQVSGAEITAGNSTSIRRFSVADIVALIVAHGGGTPPGADTTPPTRVSTTINASGLTMTDHFSEDVQFGAGGTGGRTLTASGGAVTVSSPSVSAGGNITWTLSRTIGPGETCTSTYTQPTNGIQDTATSPNDLATFTAQAVVNNSGAPVLTSTTIQPNGVTMQDIYNGSVRIGSGGSGGRTITPSGGAATLSAPLVGGPGDIYIFWTISRPILDSETVTSAYAQPGNGIEESAGSNIDTPSFTGGAVTNDSTQTSGSAAWVDAFDPTTSATKTATAEYRKRQELIAPQSGNCTKLRFYTADLIFGLGLKMKLYNAALAEISTGPAVTVGVNDAWTEFPITPVAVTSGLSYHVGFVGENGTAAQIRTKGIEPTGRIDYGDVDYTLPASFTAGIDEGFRYCVGMYIEP